MNEFDVALLGAPPDAVDTIRGKAGPLDCHAAAFDRLENCFLVACTDVDGEYRETLTAGHGMPKSAVFEDHRSLLATAEPDIVVLRSSFARSEVVVDVARSGVPAAIHCEPPVATTWGEARRVADVCAREGVQLTFDLPGRFDDVVRDAKALVDDGAIGDLQRVECNCADFPEGGISAIDVCHYFTDGRPTDWVLGQLDRDGGPASTCEGARLLATWEYQDGVRGMAASGSTASINDADWCLLGEDGFLEVHVGEELAVRVRGANGNTEKAYPNHARGETPVDRAVEAVVDALETGRESEVSAASTLTATEIVFAGYESVRRRGRVDVPLRVDDHVVETSVGAGTSDPRPGDD